MSDKIISFQIDGKDDRGQARPDDHRSRRCRRRLHPAALLQGHRAVRQLPCVHGDGQRSPGGGLHDSRCEGAVVENDTETLHEHRKMLVEMLFVSGNHFCMFCEKSGNCELQAMAYRLGIAAPRTSTSFPRAGRCDATPT
jgi:hypothetical protein